MKRASDMKPAARLAEVARIIEAADSRCLAFDGAVGRIQDALTDAEWRRIYVLSNAKQKRVKPSGRASGNKVK